MRCVTQGTVQVHQEAKDQATIVINPVPDYQVKHRSKDFVVFMADDVKKSRVFSISKSYKVPDPGIARLLTDAAAREIKIEVEIKITAPGKKAIVTAVKIPAISKP